MTALCEECYSDNNRTTPLLNPRDCLEHHVQYICGTCGRCICIDRTEKNGLQRWNFPFKSADVARLYLRTADYTMKTACGIYAIAGANGRVSYKILAGEKELADYLKRNPGKGCSGMKPVHTAGPYREFHGTQVRRLEAREVSAYLSEKDEQ